MLVPVGYSSPDQCAYAHQLALKGFIRPAYSACLAAVTPPAGVPFIDPQTGASYAHAGVFHDAFLKAFSDAMQRAARARGHQVLGVDGGDQ